MTTKRTSPIKEGNTLGKDHNTQAKKRIRKSKLRKTLEQLQSLEPQCLINIEKSVNEQEVDKEALSTSKWVINTIVTVTRAATAEESEITKLRWEGDRLGEEEEQTAKESEEEETPKTRFSLHVLPSKDDVN